MKRVESRDLEQLRRGLEDDTTTTLLSVAVVLVLGLSLWLWLYVATPNHQHALYATPPGGEPILLGHTETRVVCEQTLQSYGRDALSRGAVPALRCEPSLAWWARLRAMLAEQQRR